MTGSMETTTNFTIPVNVPAGTYSLVVTANGIASDPITFVHDSRSPDLDGNNVVDSADMGNLLIGYGACVNCAADLNMDNEVNSSDMGQLLLGYGPCQ